MKKTFFNFSLSLPLAALIGCSEALPRQEPGRLAWLALEKTEQASIETRKLLLQCQRERESAESLVREATELLRSTEEAREECRSARAEALKPRPPKVVYVREKAKSEQKRPMEAPTSEKAKERTPPEQWPEYSPSDAPKQPVEQHGEKLLKPEEKPMTIGHLEKTVAHHESPHHGGAHNEEAPSLQHPEPLD